MSPPVRIDFLSHCSDGDFFSTRAPKAKFRTALREFRDLLSDESSTGFDLFRSKMETAVHLVVNDAVGGNVPTFDVALNVLDSLSRHFQAVRDETAKAYLRTIRWGITGFQVFKSMDATSRLDGNLNHNHATIANCVKDHWSVIAYVQMEMIVCCLEWLHGALVAWNATQEDARASRASASEQSSVPDPTERPSTPNVPTEPPTPQYTIDPSTHNIAAPPTASSGLPRAPPPSTSTLEQMLSSLSTGPLPLPSGQTPFSGGPTSTVGRSSPSTSRIVSSIESPFDEASRLSAARDGQAAYPPTFNAPSPFRMSSPFHAGPSQSFTDSTPPSFLNGPSSSSSFVNGPLPSFLDTSSQSFGLSQSFATAPQQSFLHGSSQQSFINSSPQSFNNGPSQQSLSNGPSQSFLNGQQSFLNGQQSFLNGSPQSFSSGPSQQSFNNGMQLSFNNGPSQSFSSGPQQQSFNNGMQQSFTNGPSQSFSSGPQQQSFSNGLQQSFSNAPSQSFTNSSPQSFTNLQQQSYSNARSQSLTDGPSHPTQPQPPQVSAPPRPPTPAAPRVPPSIAAAQYVAPVTVDVSSPPRPSTAKATVIVTPKVLSKLAADVLKELRTRSCLGMKPRHYAKCKRENWCTSASCSYGHTKEELKIIGIARAIARGGMWKTSICDKSPKCPYGIGCDYLHDDDKRETIHAIKSHASQLVDHTYVADGQLYIEFYNGETVTIAT